MGEPTAVGLAIDHAVTVLCAPKQASAPVPGTTLRFGMGEFIVNTGTAVGGEPAVFVDAAPETGAVGRKAPDVPAGTTPLLRLLFPTREQAQAVCFAMVNAAPSARVGVEIPSVVAYPTATGGTSRRVDEWLERWLANCDYHEALVYKATLKFLRALAQQPAAVDEAMVERGTDAAIAASTQHYPGESAGDAWRRLVGDVLTAALAGQQQENVNGE